MAASGKTEKLGLSLWEATDRPARLDFRTDNEQLEKLVGGHLADAAAHLLTGEKSFLSHPFKLISYQGNSFSSRAVSLGMSAAAVFVFCGGHPPVEKGEDGVVHVYWDFWLDDPTGAGNYLSVGGVSVNGSQCVVSSKTASGKRFHLNDTGERYTLLVLPKLS